MIQLLMNNSISAVQTQASSLVKDLAKDLTARVFPPAAREVARQCAIICDFYKIFKDVRSNGAIVTDTLMWPDFLRAVRLQVPQLIIIPDDLLREKFKVFLNKMADCANIKHVVAVYERGDQGKSTLELSKVLLKLFLGATIEGQKSALYMGCEEIMHAACTAALKVGGEKRLSKNLSVDMKKGKIVRMIYISVWSRKLCRSTCFRV